MQRYVKMVIRRLHPALRGWWVWVAGFAHSLSPSLCLCGACLALHDHFSKLITFIIKKSQPFRNYISLMYSRHTPSAAHTRLNVFKAHGQYTRARTRCSISIHTYTYISIPYTYTSKPLFRILPACWPIISPSRRSPLFFLRNPTTSVRPSVLPVTHSSARAHQHIARSLAIARELHSPPSHPPSSTAHTHKTPALRLFTRYGGTRASEREGLMNIYVKYFGQVYTLVSWRFFSLACV